MGWLKYPRKARHPSEPELGAAACVILYMVAILLPGFDCDPSEAPSLQTCECFLGGGARSLSVAEACGDSASITTSGAGLRIWGIRGIRGIRDLGFGIPAQLGALSHPFLVGRVPLLKRTSRKNDTNLGRWHRLDVSPLPPMLRFAL